MRHTCIPTESCGCGASGGGWIAILGISGGGAVGGLGSIKDLRSFLTSLYKDSRLRKMIKENSRMTNGFAAESRDGTVGGAEGSCDISAQE